jgi:hypothetical protein
VGELDSHLRRLNEAPSGTAETRRAFRVGAELADIVATRAWDEAARRSATSSWLLSWPTSPAMTRLLAEDHFSEELRDGDAATPSVRSMDEAELMGVIGARYRDLSRHDPRHAAQAQDYIGRAITPRDPDRVRNQAFDLVGLARAHLITREPERAAELIGIALAGRAVDVRPSRSQAPGLHREARPFATVPAVRDIREVVAGKLAI